MLRLWLLLVSVKKGSPLAGFTAAHSGRSIRVAPTASAASRVLMAISAASANRDDAQFSLELLDSAISTQAPVPSASNRATYSRPLSRYLSPTAMRSLALASAAFLRALETNL